MNKNIKRLLFGVAIASVIGFAQVATAAPSSTIVQNLFITGLNGSNTPCLQLGTNNLVTTAANPCGSGGGSSTTFNNITTSTLSVKAGAGVGVVSSTDGTGQAIITISNTGVSSFNGATGTVTYSAATGTPVYYVAASNAPQYEKNIANAICTGVDDGACINTAIGVVSTTFPNGSGLVQLSDGTFNVSTTIANTGKNFIGLNGDGPNNTILNMTSTATYGIHWGNGQISNSNTTGYLSNFTINGNSTSSIAGFLIDGGGSGSYYNNISIDSNLKYGYILEDADRVSLNNVRASGGYLAACDYRVGSQNTFGKVLNQNGECGVTYSSSTGVLFDADSDQSSPNPPDVITFENLHMQENSGVTTGTCMMFDVGVRDLVVTGSGFENCDTQINTEGNEVDGVFGTGDAFINSLKNSNYILYAGGYANITFDTDEFQESTVGFYGSGVNLSFIGTSKNNGNITNLFGGSFGYRGGTDTAFAGSGNLVLGQYNSPYNQIYGQQVNYNNGTLNTQQSSVGGVIGANSTLEVDNGTQGVLGGFNAEAINNFLYYPIGSNIDLGTFANNAYASSSINGTIYVASNLTYSVGINFNTSGKYFNLICAPGVQISYTGTGAAYTDNSGGTFYHVAHVLQGCAIHEPNYQSAGATTTGIYLGGTNGSVALTVDGVTVDGFGVALGTGHGSFMDAVNNSVFRNDNQFINQTSSNYSGENMSYNHDQFTDCGNNTTTKCVYLGPFSSGDTTFSNSSFDDAALYADYDNYSVVLLKDHFENSNVSAYGSYIPVVASTTTNITDIGSGYNNDSNSSGNNPAVFISCNGGKLDLVGTSFQSNGGQTITNAVNGSCSLEDSLVSNINSAITNIYNGHGIPVLDTRDSGGTTALGNTQVYGTLKDTSGNNYVTSTSAGGVASTTPFTVGNLTIVSSSGALSTFGGSNTSSTNCLTGVTISASGTLSNTNTSCGGSGGVATTTAFSAKYLSEASSSQAITNSPLYSPSANDLTLGSTTDNGLFSVVNASNTAVFQIASTTNNANILSVGSTTSGPYLGVTSSGIPLFLGSTTAVSIGGTSLALDACTSTTSVIPFVLSTSTDVVNTEAQVQPGNPSTVNYNSYISAVSTGSSTITTQVCGLVTAGVTPTASKYNFSIQRDSGM